jgi:16S rRNA (uracil1498-N3)-methyltransferase
MDQYKKLPRLYVGGTALAEGLSIVLPEAKAHYLRNVMRLGPGDGIRLFNGIDGEWLARIAEVNKKNLLVTLVQPIAEQKASPDIHVIASPVKREAFEYMIEKASELGASVFHPAICDHTVVHRINEDRLRLIAAEAAEQCERFDVMNISKIRPLEDILEVLGGRVALACLERSSVAPMGLKIDGLERGIPLAVIIGPEGGFSEKEKKIIENNKNIIPVSLGPRILRAETALSAALTLAQAACGDWN